MRNAWALFVSDLKHIAGNVITLLLVVGLITIPSLFSWYNLLACWSVFDNMGNLQVAVANSDEGYKSDLVPLKVNIGDQVVSALRANDQLDWVITDEDDAVDGARSGRYYAALVIPADFSKDMMTFFSPNAEHAAIQYYTNQKINAIAPKFTEVGADGISAEVNKVFEETISEIALGVSSALMDYADNPQTQTSLSTLAARMDSLGTQLGHSAVAMGAYGAVFESAETLVAGSNRLLESAGASAGSVDASFQSARQACDQALVALEGATDSLEALIGSLEGDSENAKTALEEAFDASAAAAQQTENALNNLADSLEAAGDSATAQMLRDTAGAIGAAREEVEQARQDLLERTDASYEKLQAVKTSYEQELKPRIDELMALFEEAGTALDSTTAQLADTNATLGSASDSLIAQLQDAQGKIGDASSQLQESGAKLGDLGKRLASALATSDREQIRSIIGTDPAAFASKIASPIGLDRIVVYPVNDFGSAMAPLYTSLALWIGALLIMVALKPQPSAEALGKLRNPTDRQIFFGRFLTVGSVSLLQSTLLALGNLLFIGVQAEHPFLYMLCFWVAGLVFAFIMYTLVALFANLGKALGVILLVVQISGGGGSYPLSVLPQPIQDVSPYLPITHAIDAMRAAMFGIYQNDFWIELGQLALFVVPFLLMVLLLIGPLKRIVPRFVARIEASEVM